MGPAYGRDARDAWHRFRYGSLATLPGVAFRPPLLAPASPAVRHPPPWVASPRRLARHGAAAVQASTNAPMLARLHFRAMCPSLPVDNEPLGDMSRTFAPCTIYHATQDRKAIENGATATAVGHMPQRPRHQPSVLMVAPGRVKRRFHSFASPPGREERHEQDTETDRFCLSTRLCYGDAAGDGIC